MAKKKKGKAQVGDIYAVTNDCYVKVYSPWAKKMVRPVKIGRGGDAHTRIGNMSASVFQDFIYHVELRVKDFIKCERQIQRLFRYHNLTTKRGGKTEFYSCPLEEVIKEIKEYVRDNPDLIIKAKFNGVKGKSYGRSAVSQKRTLREQEQAKKLRRKKAARGNATIGRRRAKANFDFNMVGLRNGARLVFIPTGDKVTAVAPNQVKRNGEVLTLTGYAKKYMPTRMRNSKDSYQGPAYFAYKGKKLTKLREEMGQG